MSLCETLFPLSLNNWERVQPARTLVRDRLSKPCWSSVRFDRTIRVGKVVGSGTSVSLSVAVKSVPSWRTACTGEGTTNECKENLRENFCASRSCESPKLDS